VVFRSAGPWLVKAQARVEPWIAAGDRAYVDIQFWLKA
jgi:hypothetical protein